MRRLNRFARWTAAVLIALTPLGQQVATANLQRPAEDGWQTWRVDAAADVGEWCCYTWAGGMVRQQACDLDKRDGNHLFVGSSMRSSPQIQIYALMKNGRPQKLRTVSPHCKVTSMSKVTDLGEMSASDSVQWLQRYVVPRSRLSSDAIAAISAHAGSEPASFLKRIVSDGGDVSNSEEALFWMVHNDVDVAIDVIEGILFP